jgi:hypothetical protein
MDGHMNVKDLFMVIFQIKIMSHWFASLRATYIVLIWQYRQQGVYKSQATCHLRDYTDKSSVWNLLCITLLVPRI